MTNLPVGGVTVRLTTRFKKNIQFLLVLDLGSTVHFLAILYFPVFLLLILENFTTLKLKKVFLEFFTIFCDVFGSLPLVLR